MASRHTQILGCTVALLAAAAGLSALHAQGPVPIDAGGEVPLPPAPGSALDGGTQSAEPLPTTATIVFVTNPAVAANVTWGRKKLGRILPGKPLVVVRPRDSGPLDVVVRAVGYMAVQTRAHTFSDSRVVVKLTPPELASELLGYRAPLDGGLEGGLSDGGVSEGGVTDAAVAYDAAQGWWEASVAPTPAPLSPLMP